MATLTISNETDEDFDWEISGLQSDFTPTYYIRCGVALEQVSQGQSYPPDYIIDTVSSSSGNSNTTGTQNTADRMTPNDNRTVYGFAQVANGDYYQADSDTARMDPMDITQSNITHESIDLDFSSVYYSDYYQIFWSTSTDPYDTDSGSFEGGSDIFYTSNYTIEGLSELTTYYYIVEVVEESGLGGSAVEQDIESFTTIANPRPDDWDWTTNFVQGGTITADGKLLPILPATEWNTFTNRVNDFRDYEGLSAYSFTTVITDDDFEASIMNEAITAISAMNYTTAPPSSVNTGDDITAQIFLDLETSLNSIP